MRNSPAEVKKGLRGWTEKHQSFPVTQLHTRCNICIQLTSWSQEGIRKVGREALWIFPVTHFHAWCNICMCTTHLLKSKWNWKGGESSHLQLHTCTKYKKTNNYDFVSRSLEIHRLVRSVTSTGWSTDHAMPSAWSADQHFLRVALVWDSLVGMICTLCNVCCTICRSARKSCMICRLGSRCYGICRLCANLQIGRQPMDSQIVQHDLQIMQIPRSCGTISWNQKDVEMALV